MPSSVRGLYDAAPRRISLECILSLVKKLSAPGFVTRLQLVVSKQSNAFVSGFNTWRKGEKKISEHERSPSHRGAMLASTSLRGSKGRVDHDLVKQYEAECSYWHYVLKHAVSVIQRDHWLLVVLIN